MLSIMLMTYAARPRLRTCRSSRHESSRTWLFLFSTCQWRRMIVMHALPAFHGQESLSREPLKTSPAALPRARIPPGASRVRDPLPERYHFG